MEKILTPTFDQTTTKVTLSLELWELEEIKRALARMNKQREYSNNNYSKNLAKTPPTVQTPRKPRLVIGEIVRL